MGLYAKRHYYTSLRCLTSFAAMLLLNLLCSQRVHPLQRRHPDAVSPNRIRRAMSGTILIDPVGAA